MKTNQFLSMAFVLFALGTSCKNDAYRDLQTDADQYGKVSFTSSITGAVNTRVTGNKWDSNDAIGVFMKQGSGLTNVLAANKKYVTSGDGNFSGADGDVINYPEDGSVDFIAYYPYSTNVSNNTLAVNVSNQTNFTAIDVLYANNAVGQNKESGVANLAFTHKLSKIELSVKAGNGVTGLTGLTSVYQNVNTTANLDLANGNLSSISGAQQVSAKVTAQGADQLVEAILIPGDYSGKEVLFTVNGENYKWVLPTSLTYEAGKKYTYNLVLQTSESGPAVEVKGSATITDWNTVPGGSFTLTKEEGEIVTPEPGVEQTFFSESFGESGPTSGTRARISSYSDYQVKTVTYSDLYTAEYADVRATGSMNTHVWFAANRTTGLKIEGIDATGYTNLKLAYDLAANGAGAPINAVKVRVNGVEKTINGTLDAQNTYSTIQIENINASNSLTIEFDVPAASNSVGFRLDNVKVLGTK